MVTAITMTYAAEAIGIARAATRYGLPVAISFTVETDGRLPSGETLGDAILEVDAETGAAPAYYMVNCAHPTHFEHVLDGAVGGAHPRPARERVDAQPRGARRGRELDEGDPHDLGARYAALRARLPRLNVLGGCCGTDHRHVAAIAGAW